MFFYWGRKWQPTPVSLPGKSHGWRSLVGSPKPTGVTKSRTRLSDFTFTLCFSICSIMSFVNSDSFTASFPIWTIFISSSCMIAVAKTSTILLNKSCKCGHPYFVSDLRGKLSAF